jgi:HTH-type transcriptional repressor of NAD biosynthesis genes
VKPKLKRVCIVGAESTGTTSLAQMLAEHYQTVWVPEYGREYTERRKDQGEYIVWCSDEFVHIAEEQQRREDLHARRAKRVLFCDTDALATCVWHERYMGFWSKEVEEVANRRRYDLYFLTLPDIPFVQDRIRDSELLRGWMTQRFRDELIKREYAWKPIYGAVEKRMQQATDAVDELLAGSLKSAKA